MLKLHSNCTILNKEHTGSSLRFAILFFWLIISMVGNFLDPQLFERVCVAVFFILSNVKQGIYHNTVKVGG